MNEFLFEYILMIFIGEQEISKSMNVVFVSKKELFNPFLMLFIKFFAVKRHYYFYEIHENTSKDFKLKALQKKN